MDLTNDEKRRAGDLHRKLAQAILESENVPCVAICATLIHLAGASLNALILTGTKGRRANLEWAKGALERSVDLTFEQVETAAREVEAADKVRH